MILLNIFSYFKGSRDNISAVVIKLPGAVIGPASNGGVARLRELKSVGRSNGASTSGHGQTG